MGLPDGGFRVISSLFVRRRVWLFFVVVRSLAILAPGLDECLAEAPGQQSEDGDHDKGSHDEGGFDGGLEDT